MRHAVYLFLLISPTGHTGNIVSPSTTTSATPSSYSEPSAVDQADMVNPNVTKQDVVSPHEPSTIDQALSQTTFSTFGVTDRPAVADGYNIHDYEDSSDFLLQQHRTVEQSDSFNRDGLEDSHSSFSTFSVPANRFL